MIKVKALKIFEDLYTGQVYKVGDILEISKERYEEIEKNLELYGGNFLQYLEEVASEEVEKVSDLTENEEAEKKSNKRGSKKVTPDETTED